tara:strand:- start:411 stop:1478 length:1068 start_codon:yes stop_codon:yes gene_type:complete
MAYTTIDDASLYFRVKTYTGNSTNNTAITWDETHANMQPDWLWLKQRTVANQEHWLADSVRGAGLFLESNSGVAEADGTGGFDSFDTNGFTVDDSARTNRGTMVGWGWKAGTSFTNDASSTGVGTIDSTGTINTTAGFSVISYTGTGSAGTIAHGLGVVPRMVITKNRDHGSSGLQDWCVYHPRVGSDGAVFLNLTNTKDTHAKYFNDTDPTSSVFSVGTNLGTNGSADAMISYVFAEKKGYSKIGSYHGNDNADGPVIYLGFSPSWIMIKRINSTNDWIILDNKRDPDNPSTERLLANTRDAASTANTMVDFLSSGFKPRSTYGGINGSGDQFIYLAFAESPFTNSNGVPTNAR